MNENRIVIIFELLFFSLLSRDEHGSRLDQD